LPVILKDDGLEIEIGSIGIDPQHERGTAGLHLGHR